MELTFLGHQTWLVSHKGTNVIIDPLLLNQFGHSSDIHFEVFPSRNIHLKGMPKIDAIILSHEHLDHFHIPSLMLLPKEAPFYVNHLLPKCVKKVIIDLGFKLVDVNPMSSIRVKDLELMFFPAASETVFWEKRVIQVLVQPVDSPEKGVFIAVDAMISDEFKKAIEEENVVTPRAILISNNSQILPTGGVGAHSNLLPLQERFGKALPGLQVLHSLLVSYLEGVESINEIILCGNGFITGSGSHGASELYGPFLFSDNKKLAAIATDLAVEKTIFGPYPGERFNLDSEKIVTSKVDWVELDNSRIQDLLNVQRKFLAEPTSVEISSIIKKKETAEDISQNLEAVQAELPFLARAIMLSEMGKIALSMPEHLKGPLGTKRILLRFLTQLDVYQYALDFSEAEFILDETPISDLVESFPFGMEVFLSDFAAVIQGQLQIWDLAGNAMRSWYVGDSYSNIISFLYAYFGEQVRPDLAAKVYERALAKKA